MPVVMQRQALRPSINQVTKHAEFTQNLHIDKSVDLRVVMDTDGFEDCESPAGAVHQPSSGRALEEIVEAISAPHERVQQRTVEHRIAVDVPTPQIMEEIVEATSAPHERVKQRTVEHRIADQTVLVPTPQIPEEIVEAGSAPHERVQQRTVEQQIVVAADSDCLEDSGTPSDSESDLAESSDDESAEEAKRPRLWSRRHWGRRQGPRDGWSWARNSWYWRW